MSYLTKYGTLWGAIPNTTGRVFWVSPAYTYTIEGRTYTASDDHDGLSPERALRTVNQAYSNVTSGASDVVVLLPGAHTLSANITWTKSMVTMIGLPSGKGNSLRPRATLTGIAGSDALVLQGAADVEFAHIRFIPITALTAISFNGTCHRLYVHDCSLDMATPAANTGTIGIEAAAAGAQHVRVEDNYFESDGAQGEGINITGCVDFLIKNNYMVVYVGTWARAILCSTASRGIIQGNVITALAGGTLTDGIIGTDITSASSVLISDNRFGDDVSVAIDDFGAGDAIIVENYQGSIGGGSGGVLVTAIT